MRLSPPKIIQRLSKYQLFMDVALNDQNVKPIFENYGYAESVVSEGKSLFDNAYHLQQLQKKEYGEQHGATDEFHQA